MADHCKNTALLLALALAAPVALAAPQAAAWFESDQAARSVRILRAGKAVPSQANAGLRPCDRLQLVDTTQVVRIVLANGRRMRLDSSQPLAAIPCKTPGVGAALGRLLAAWGNQADSRATMAGAMSRGGAATGGPLAIPLLFAPDALVMARADRMHLVWRGGAAPFDLVLNDAAGAQVASRSGIRERRAVLDLPAVAAGRFGLVLRGADGAAMEADNIELVDASAIPSMPDALREARLDPVARQLFYADYLVAFEDGRYAMQALQQVAAIRPQTAQTRAWLAYWGADE